MRYLAIAAVLVLASCSTQEQGMGESTTLSAAGSKGPGSFSLSCIEKKTLTDHPGIESKIDVTGNAAQVARRSVSMMGAGEWQMDNSTYSVESQLDGNVQRLWIVEQVDKTVDWATHGSCFKFVPQDSYRLAKTPDGRWEGVSQLMPNIIINPDEPDCIYPMPALPRPEEIACTQN